jgi:hypothetical protein
VLATSESVLLGRAQQVSLMFTDKGVELNRMRHRGPSPQLLVTHQSYPATPTDLPANGGQCLGTRKCDERHPFQ